MVPGIHVFLVWIGWVYVLTIWIRGDKIIFYLVLHKISSYYLLLTTVVWFVDVEWHWPERLSQKQSEYIGGYNQCGNHDHQRHHFLPFQYPYRKSGKSSPSLYNATAEDCRHHTMIKIESYPFREGTEASSPWFCLVERLPSGLHSPAHHGSFVTIGAPIRSGPSFPNYVC